MPKERRTKRKETQHEKFVKLARESGADESESAFVAKLRKLAKTTDQKPKRQRKK